MGMQEGQGGCLAMVVRKAFEPFSFCDFGPSAMHAYLRLQTLNSFHFSDKMRKVYEILAMLNGIGTYADD